MRRCLLLAGTLAVAACDLLVPGAPPEELTLAGPLEGLTGAQLAQHFRGDEEFGRIFGVRDGLGPIFVAPSCETCHPGDGKGHLAFNLTRFGRMDGARFDPLRHLGGPQLQHRAVLDYRPEVVPPVATGVARFTPPSVTGLGFLEAVDDLTLLALEDPDDRDGDGISGRVQLVDASDAIAEIARLDELLDGTHAPRVLVDGKYIGRFGKKASAISLLHQTVTAYLEDMGITSDVLPNDLVNRQVGGFAADAAPDPEVSSAAVQAVVFYLRTLKPPPRRNANDPQVRTGEEVFISIGCALCHRPALTTGRSSIAPLDRVEFYPYTDLLLHDMGPELDDYYTEGRALTSEWRTAPLWGIGLAERSQGGRGFFLHDGRARSLRDAIELHGGEAARSRAAFRALGRDLQEALLAFLRSL